MENHEVRAARRAASSLLASLVLRYIEDLKADHAPQRDGRHALRRFSDRLRASRNGAVQVSISADEIDPTSRASLADELADYALVKELIRAESSHDVRVWTDTAQEILGALQEEGVGAIRGDAAKWAFLQTNLEPFLDQLADLEGETEYEEVFRSERDAVSL
jgi:hypothetical protein